MTELEPAGNRRFYSLAPLHTLLRPLAWRSPIWYWPVGILRHRTNIFSSNYDVLVDGYPRSANTFVANALSICAKNDLRVRSHFHTPAVVQQAVRSRIPCVVVIREPIEAIVAWTAMSRFPINYTLPSYIEYYEKIKPLIGDVLAATFEECTANVRSLVHAYNVRFNASLDSELLGEQSNASVFKAIENEFVAANGSIDEQRISRPSTARARVKERVRNDLLRPQWAEQLDRARDIYAATISARIYKPTEKISNE